MEDVTYNIASPFCPSYTKAMCCHWYMVTKEVTSSLSGLASVFTPANTVLASDDAIFQQFPAKNNP